MKNINPIFTDEEIEKIQVVKKKAKLNWHDFVITTSEFYDEHH